MFRHTVEIERMPAHPQAVLALSLGESANDPIPYRPGLLETHLGITTNGLLRAPERDETPMPTQATPIPEAPPRAGLLERLERLEVAVADLDDNMGACLEEHGALLAALLLRLDGKAAIDPAPVTDLGYARRAIETALRDLDVVAGTALAPGVRPRLQAAIDALGAALEETQVDDQG